VTNLFDQLQLVDLLLLQCQELLHEGRDGPLASGGPVAPRFLGELGHRHLGALEVLNDDVAVDHREVAQCRQVPELR
jgi:hypothetical protein